MKKKVVSVILATAMVASMAMGCGYVSSNRWQFFHLLMSVYYPYFRTILSKLLLSLFIPFSRRLFQRLFSMLSALHPGAAYDV